MPIVQITYDVPLDIAKRLATGEWTTLGTAAIRDSTGITAHIREISRTVSDGADPGAAALAKAFRNPKFVVLGVGVVAIAAAGGVAGWAARKKQAARPEVPECVANYNASLAAYLDAIGKGSLDADLLTSLISDLDTVKEQLDIGTIALEFSVEESATLVSIVADYTNKLAEANSVNPAPVENTDKTSADSTVIYLRHYLEVQRKIFDQSA